MLHNVRSVYQYMKRLLSAIYAVGKVDLSHSVGLRAKYMPKFPIIQFGTLFMDSPV